MYLVKVTDTSLCTHHLPPAVYTSPQLLAAYIVLEYCLLYCRHTQRTDRLPALECIYGELWNKRSFMSVVYCLAISSLTKYMFVDCAQCVCVHFGVHTLANVVLDTLANHTAHTYTYS